MKENNSNKKNSANEKRSGKKFSFGRLFYNNRFIMIFSLLASVVLWFVVSSSPDNEQVLSIHDVPVTVNLSEYAKANNLKVFSQSVTAATVTVRGSALTLANLSNNDITVNVKNVETVTEANRYTLNLVATKQKQSIRTNYEIDSIDPTSVTIIVDEEEVKEFAVEDGLTYRVGAGYYAPSVKFDIPKVTLSGPKGEMDKVAKVKAVHQFDGELTQTQKATAKLVLYDSNDQVINSKYIIRSDTGDLVDNVEFDIELVVLSKKEIPLKVDFLNKPAEFNVSNRVTIDPVNLLVAGTEEQITNLLNTFKLDPIDFSTLNPDTQTIIAKINLPQGLENLSNYREATVRIDMTGMASKTIEVPVENMLTFTNLSSDKDAKCLTTALTVTVVGPEDQLEAMTEANILAAVDLTGKTDLTGHAEMPVKLSVTGNTNCWIFGTEYKVNVDIEKKAS